MQRTWRVIAEVIQATVERPGHRSGDEAVTSRPGAAIAR